MKPRKRLPDYAREAVMRRKLARVLKPVAPILIACAGYEAQAVLYLRDIARAIWAAVWPY